MTNDHRGHWGSRLGFILAAAGSAVGLGNIWGFPTRVGQGGGAVFVLVYLGCVFLIAAPVMIAEIAIGRHTQKSPVGAFRTFRPGTAWPLVGVLGVVAGVGILGFYSVIAGWTLAYIWFAATGAMGTTPESVQVFFANFTANGWLNIALAFAILLASAGIIIGGVRTGIERATKVMMPALFILLIILAARAVTLPGAAAGLRYYLTPDFSRAMDIRVVNAALGQAFFSLSLGMGTMLTYGSYLARQESIGRAVLWVVSLDTSVALLAGFLVFPSGFSIPGFDPSTSGPGLIFVVLPRLFASLPGGHLFGAAFFILLLIAALTSAISLLEVPVAHLIDVHRWSRPRAVLVMTFSTLLLAIPCALANGASPFFSRLPGFGTDFLTLMVTLWNDFALPIGGFLIAIFVGYAWRIRPALEELTAHGAWFPFPAVWAFLLRYVCPVGIFLIIVFSIRALLGV